MALHIQRKTGETVSSIIDLTKGDELSLKVERVDSRIKLAFVSTAPIIVQVQNVTQDVRSNSWQFKYWARNESEKKGARSGDHIDLWNDSRITHGNLVSFGSYLGRAAGINELHIGSQGYSDHDKANPILFWEMK